MWGKCAITTQDVEIRVSLPYGGKKGWLGPPNTKGSPSPRAPKTRHACWRAPAMWGLTGPRIKTCRGVPWVGYLREVSGTSRGKEFCGSHQGPGRVRPRRRAQCRARCARPLQPRSDRACTLSQSAHRAARQRPDHRSDCYRGAGSYEIAPSRLRQDR